MKTIYRLQEIVTSHGSRGVAVFTVIDPFHFHFRFPNPKTYIYLGVVIHCGEKRELAASCKGGKLLELEVEHEIYL